MGVLPTAPTCGLLQGLVLVVLKGIAQFGSRGTEGQIDGVACDGEQHGADGNAQGQGGTCGFSHDLGFRLM